MKGIVFNLLESFICEGWGDETYEAVLAACPLHTKEPFVGPGTYPDADLITIAKGAAAKLGLPLDDALRAFGAYAFPHLAARFPGFVEGQPDARTFLLSVEDVIHVEVRKLMPEAVTPRFDYTEPAPDELTIAYRSERKLCPLMEGLLDGVRAYFDSELEFTHDRCLRHGADACGFSIHFPELASSKVA